MGIVSFEVTGAEETKVGLANFQKAFKDLTPFWREVFAPKYFAIVIDLFKTGGRSRGGGGKFKSGAWAPLSPKYRIWKEAHYPERPVLVAEGKLFRSLRWAGWSLGEYGVFIPKPSFVVAGTSVPYGIYHQQGTKKMPARNFLPPPDPAVFAPLLQQWLMKFAPKAK